MLSIGLGGAGWVYRCPKVADRKPGVAELRVVGGYQLEGPVRQLASLLEKAIRSGLVYPAKSKSYYQLLEAVD